MNKNVLSMLYVYIQMSKSAHSPKLELSLSGWRGHKERKKEKFRESKLKKAEKRKEKFLFICASLVLLKEAYTKIHYNDYDEHGK